MGFQVDDGKGRGYVAGVNKNQKLLTLAETNQTGHYVSVRDGLAFNIVSTCSSCAAGNHVLYFKNTDADRHFFVDVLRVGAASTATWKVWKATGDSTGASTITPANLNFGSNQKASAHVRGNGVVTGFTQDTLVAIKRHPANQDGDVPFDDVLVLATDDAIAVEYDVGSSGAVEVLMRGYYVTLKDEA